MCSSDLRVQLAKMREWRLQRKASDGFDNESDRSAARTMERMSSQSVDSIDFDLVDDRSAEMGERVRDAMELYQIGRFLDLDILSQNCEDAIVQRLNPANICEVLDWSGQPYGSAWVHRQAHQFLLEDFPNIAASPALERLGKDTMKLLLTSDFLQASEAEVVAAVVRWGEVCVARRGEGEHCSLPANPGKRGGRRREGVTDREVAEAVCDLVACVRMEQLLPPEIGRASCRERV